MWEGQERRQRGPGGRGSCDHYFLVEAESHDRNSVFSANKSPDRVLLLDALIPELPRLVVTEF